ncbi:vesicle-associated membrane protein 1-like, partial [Musca vetustissima]|uniref:vesicle-associated membrane protein 1-like n=1 Tax=Musca vetustissima TaxID=27455 RepID=UPI002AB7DDAE
MATDTKLNKNISNEAENQSPELLQQTQKQANEILEIITDNINKVIDRQEKLEHLNTADAIKTQADTFKTNGVTLRRKMWWSRMKTNIIIAIVIAIVVVILI